MINYYKDVGDVNKALHIQNVKLAVNVNHYIIILMLLYVLTFVNNMHVFINKIFQSSSFK